MWHDGGNRDDQLMYGIEIENKKVYRPFLMTLLFLPDMLQTDKNLYFLSLKAYNSGIWHKGTYFVAYWSHCIKKRKNVSWIK